MNNGSESKLEASIGFSRKWDAREAGREVAESTIKKLSQPPNFILLFSTIHYKDHGGFKEFLNGVWDVIPKGTPLIGGTIAGFVNNFGCYTRGATALAICYPNMDVAIGVGKHTKMLPKEAAIKCAQMIKNQLKKSSYENKFLINIISAAKVPFSGLNIVKQKYLGWLFSNIIIRIISPLGYAWGKEDEIIDELVSCLPDYYITGGSSVDSGHISENYQFIGKKVVTNSIVAIGCHTDLDISLESNIGVHETDKKFEITRSKYNGRIITKVNKKSAKEQILKQFGLAEGQFGDLGLFYYRTAFYFPITYEENREYISGITAFFGNDVALGTKIRGKNVRLLYTTGKEVIDLINDTFHDFNKNQFPFMFIFSSLIFMNTFGSKTHIIKEELDKYLKEIPYLMVCPLYENIGFPNKKVATRAYSFNALSLKRRTGNN